MQASREMYRSILVIICTLVVLSRLLLFIKKVVCVFNFLFRLIGSPGGGFYLFAFDNTNM